eukprot:TRINITY_DN773_c0_g1_i9.p2 TRINITY_DN773_c0_g1~~TRINITY_DN773_c0_g1_i9.p2  ORF type:complete len:104 (-),score=33.57 TRINITY_DN773_c0_g1_i9:131-442(-)
MPTGLLDPSLLSHLHPTVPGVFEVWAHPDKIKSFSKEGGEKVMIKTCGAWFVGDIQINDGLVGTFKGEGSDLMNQVGSLTAQVVEGELEQDKMEGVDSDEWSD